MSERAARFLDFSALDGLPASEEGLQAFAAVALPPSWTAVTGAEKDGAKQLAVVTDVVHDLETQAEEKFRRMVLHVDRTAQSTLRGDLRMREVRRRRPARAFRD